MSSQKSPFASKSAPQSEVPPAGGGVSENRTWTEKILHFLIRFQRYGWDIGGILVLALAVMTAAALIAPQSSGGLLAWAASFSKSWFGWGSVWIIVALAFLGICLLRMPDPNPPLKVRWDRIISMEITALSTLALLSLFGGSSLSRAEQGLDGGRIGWALDEVLKILLAKIGLADPFWLALGLALTIAISLGWGFGWWQSLLSWLASEEPQGDHAAERGLTIGALSEAPIAGPGKQPSQEAQRGRKNVLPIQFRKNFRITEEAQGEPKTFERDERLPPLELLSNELSARPDERVINMNAGLIEKTLAEFGIPARVVGFRVGPAVTQYAVEPGFLEKEKPGADGDSARQKIRVAQISNLNRDLALALSAERLRIEAPVPGKPYIGIEIPNSKASVVRLRPILESEAFQKLNSPLAIAIGRDVSGAPVVADLGQMPHLLIAGTTGSGKSVCIGALTTCLVVNNTPEDLRLVLIDPKMVELVRFNGLPHLLGKVETDQERIQAVLRWVVIEMDRRYKLLESTHSRNLDTYNRKIRKRKDEKPLSRIVVMIDELADLMMSAPDQTEHNLVRLAQMARATGIHLVVATQRPSTDVVTGLIKANFPARISFSVASGVDSRVILDTSGAETLLGRGDMLFLPPEASGPLRCQGVMVTDQEIERTILFWQDSSSEMQAEQAAPWEELLEAENTLGGKDELIDKAIAIVQATQRASASLLQRRLRIGYPRAARLIDELEKLGIIGPAQSGGREREVFIARSLEEEDKYLG